MREYKSREEAARDPDLNLRIVWECNKCKARREEPLGCNEGGQHYCGGEWVEVGESYNG